jgi:hypothetical protein
MTDSERDVVLLIYVNELRVIMRVIYVQFVCTYWQNSTAVDGLLYMEIHIIHDSPPPPFSLNPPLLPLPTLISLLYITLILLIS